MNDCCGNCTAWRTYTGQTAGECRARSPVVSYATVGAITTTTRGAAWPVTDEAKWCREHARAPGTDIGNG